MKQVRAGELCIIKPLTFSSPTRVSLTFYNFGTCTQIQMYVTIDSMTSHTLICVDHLPVSVYCLPVRVCSLCERLAGRFWTKVDSFLRCAENDGIDAFDGLTFLISHLFISVFLLFNYRCGMLILKKYCDCIIIRSPVVYMQSCN